MIDVLAAAAIHCSVVNQSALISRREMPKIARVCNHYAELVHGVWKMPGGVIKVYLVDTFNDEYRDAHWGGYHQTGRIVKINVKSWYGFGYRDIFIALTHEVAEAVAMPNPRADGSGEIADPVNGSSFTFEEVKVANFLTPEGTPFTEL